MNTEPQAFVCVSGDWLPLAWCEFINVEEDIQGRDLVTFEYQGKTYQSFVTMKFQ